MCFITDRIRFHCKRLQGIFVCFLSSSSAQAQKEAKSLIKQTKNDPANACSRNKPLIQGYQTGHSQPIPVRHALYCDPRFTNFIAPHQACTYFLRTKLKKSETD